MRDLPRGVHGLGDLEPVSRLRTRAPGPGGRTARLKRAAELLDHRARLDDADGPVLADDLDGVVVAALTNELLGLEHMKGHVVVRVADVQLAIQELDLACEPLDGLTQLCLLRG